MRLPALIAAVFYQPPKATWPACAEQRRMWRVHRYVAAAAYVRFGTEQRADLHREQHAPGDEHLGRAEEEHELFRL